MQDRYNNLNAISNLFIAELAEGKERFIDQLVNDVFHTCEMTTWSLSAHPLLQRRKRSFPDYHDEVIDLVVGNVRSMISWIYYFLHKEFDTITPLISERIKDEVNKRILTAYLEGNYFWWMGTHVDETEGFVNNWNPWCNSNVLQCYLLMEENPRRKAKGICKTMQSVDKFINYTHSDRACEEATGGKVSIFTQPMIRQMSEYISHSYGGDGWVVNFADASAREKLKPRLIYRYGKMIKSNKMMSFAALLEKNHPSKENLNTRDVYRTLENIIMIDNDIQKRKPIHESLAYTWYPETEFCYIRSGNLFFASKGGYNDESHNHNDVGTFSLYMNNTPIFIDVRVKTSYTRQTFSSEQYTIWTMQSGFHNLPTINRYPQQYGKKYRSKNAKADQKCKHFCLDIAHPYSQEAGVKEWIRNYTVDDNSLSIEDSFKIDHPQEKNELNSMTWYKVDISQKGNVKININSQTATILYNPEQLVPHLESIELDDHRLSKVWKNKYIAFLLKLQK